MTDKMEKPRLNKSAEQAADISALLRARNPLLWVVTREESRVEGYLFEAAASAGYLARTWDVGQGVADISGKKLSIGSPDPGDTFDAIDGLARSGRERCVWIMRDLTPWIAGSTMTTAPTCRKLRNLAKTLPTAPRETAQAVIVLTPSAEVPPELAGHATVIEWPLPDREEIARILDAAIEGLPDEMKEGAAPNGTRDAAIDAAVGLTGEEAASCYARSLVALRRIDPLMVANEKKRVIARERVLEWFDPLPGGLEAVGGLDVLKSWLTTRKAAFSPAARAYGLPTPKGVLLVGVPGCGKSLTAKAIATAWGVPLLKLDLGALKSKFVGESEGNLRRALRVVEAIGRCVVWLDEIEKALAGATQGAADGGVSSDALGAILNWMQERPGDAFVIATANDVSKLPPELLRKGRFDELFFVDLPNAVERAEIVKAALRARGRDIARVCPVALPELVAATEGFTGAEIDALVPDALFAAFADNAREITTEDLLGAAETTTPQFKADADRPDSKISLLRAWKAGRARDATTPETTKSDKVRARKIDL